MTQRILEFAERQVWKVIEKLWFTEEFVADELERIDVCVSDDAISVRGKVPGRWVAQVVELRYVFSEMRRVLLVIQGELTNPLQNVLK